MLSSRFIFSSCSLIGNNIYLRGSLYFYRLTALCNDLSCFNYPWPETIEMFISLFDFSSFSWTSFPAFELFFDFNDANSDFNWFIYCINGPNGFYWGMSVLLSLIFFVEVFFFYKSIIIFKINIYKRIKDHMTESSI